MALDPMRYKMNHLKRGKAIIINNWHYDQPDIVTLSGSDVDVENITRGLKHNGFGEDDIETSDDLSREKIIDLAKSVARYDHTNADCMVFCINSHGSKRGIWGTDYKVPKDAIRIQDIVNEFVGKKCLSLVGKPKIFITNACAGKKEDHGVCMPAEELGFGPQPEKCPLTADILIFNSSYPGYGSWHVLGKGAYFMERLGYRLEKHGQTNELHAIFRKVSEEMAKHGTGDDFQMPLLSSTIRGEIYFGQQPQRRE